ncbi:hypothetical protein DMENIID0001_107010 [Sergentomyia squamirostris]
MTAMQSLKKCSGPGEDHQCPIGLFQDIVGQMRLKKRCPFCALKKEQLKLEKMKDIRRDVSCQRNKEKVREQMQEIKRMQIENEKLQAKVEKLQEKCTAKRMKLS